MLDQTVLFISAEPALAHRYHDNPKNRLSGTAPSKLFIYRYFQAGDAGNCESDLIFRNRLPVFLALSVFHPLEINNAARYQPIRIPPRNTSLIFIPLCIDRLNRPITPNVARHFGDARQFLFLLIDAHLAAGLAAGETALGADGQLLYGDRFGGFAQARL
jgi:hypothetical protein